MDTWYAIVDSDNNLVSTGTVIAEQEMLESKGFRAIPLEIDPNGKVWDKYSQSFTDHPPSPVISVLDFVKRLPHDAYAAINASNDARIALFRLEITHAPLGRVDLRSQDLLNGLQYLVSVGILTADQATSIGAP